MFVSFNPCNIDTVRSPQAHNNKDDLHAHAKSAPRRRPLHLQSGV